MILTRQKWERSDCVSVFRWYGHARTTRGRGRVCRWEIQIKMIDKKQRGREYVCKIINVDILVYAHVFFVK